MTSRARIAISQEGKGPRAAFIEISKMNSEINQTKPMKVRIREYP
jgi:hypothetical protein